MTQTIETGKKVAFVLQCRSQRVREDHLIPSTPEELALAEKIVKELIADMNQPATGVKVANNLFWTMKSYMEIGQITEQQFLDLNNEAKRVSVESVA